MKLATVDVESGDNMATLPSAAKHPSAGGAGGGGAENGAATSDSDMIERNNETNKEMELKNVMAKPLKRL